MSKHFSTDAMLSPMDKFLEQDRTGKYLDDDNNMKWDVVRADLEEFHEIKTGTAAETMLALRIWNTARDFYEIKGDPVSFAYAYDRFADIAHIAARAVTNKSDA